MPYATITIGSKTSLDQYNFQRMSLAIIILRLTNTGDITLVFYVTLVMVDGSAPVPEFSSRGNGNILISAEASVAIHVKMSESSFKELPSHAMGIAWDEL